MTANRATRSIAAGLTRHGYTAKTEHVGGNTHMVTVEAGRGIWVISEDATVNYFESAEGWRTGGHAPVEECYISAVHGIHPSPRKIVAEAVEIMSAYAPWAPELAAV